MAPYAVGMPTSALEVLTGSESTGPERACGDG